MIKEKNTIIGNVIGIGESGCLLSNYNGKNIKIITGDVFYL